MTPHPPGEGDDAPGGGGTGGGSVPSDCAKVAGPVGVGATTVVSGFRVHQCLQSAVSGLLAEAAAAGLNLGGWGYRSYSQQIATRKNNCGTSSYAIYQMPAAQCSPPTAPPGTSMHERGLAIDFTNNGSLISSRSDPAFRWLAANAGTHGLRNLPSEPWHWSTNGR
jgi:LAS superfamily LD-carboxypeptidase LdcB